MGLRFSTTESGHTIRQQLYLNDRENSSFECHIVVPVVKADSVTNGIKSLYVTRKYDKESEYRLANGDAVYNTTASLSPEGEKFTIDIIVRHEDSDLVPATISMSEDAIRAAERFVEDLGKS